MVTSADVADAINENSGAGQVIYTATADDSADVSGGVTFSLAAASDAALSIDATTGEVTLATDPDQETQDQYNFTVVATDAAGNASGQAVSLDINDLDDTAPVVTSAGVADAINENSGAGQVIYTATADDSADVSGGVTFSLAADSDAALSIDANTGAVTLATDPDQETQDQYSFAVVATDAAGNASAAQSVTLDINDLDDTAPTITSADNAAVNEGSGTDQVVYTATSDDSTDVSDGVTYSLVDNSPDPVSQPDSTPEVTDSNQVISASGDDAQSGGQVSLAINYNAADSQLPGLGLRVHYDSSMLSVAEVTDVLDKDLIYTDTNPQADSADLDNNSSTDAFITVAWASLGGDWPGTELPDSLLNVVFDVASDATGSAAVDFSATSTPIGYDLAGAGYAIQIIDSPLSIDSSTGEVTLAENPDFETQESYNFTVKATDAAGNSTEQMVDLNVINLDEAAPVITSGAAAATIDENSGESQVIYTATASDSADTSDGFTFSLVEGSDAALSIDANTGAVTLATDPDQEARGPIQLCSYCH